MRWDMKTITGLGASLGLLSLCVGGGAYAIKANTAPVYTVTGDDSVSSAALRTAIDAIFEDDAMGDSRALVVMHGGRIVAERYAPGFGPDSRFLSWSIAKSVTAVLVGLMVSDGRLALDAPAPVAAWSQPGDPRGGITLRQLLNMTSGLNHAEEADVMASADTVRMLFGDGAKDMAGFAEDKPLGTAPGSGFAYNSGATMILSDILIRQLTDSRDPVVRQRMMQQFIDGRLKAPARLRSLTPEYDASGALIGSTMIHMTARDFARFGELLRNHGRAGGHQMVAESWIDFMTSPSKRNRAYGGHLWLNRSSEDSRLLAGQAPESMFGCIGHNGQYILISPQQRLTIVRLGISSEEEQAALRAGLAKLVSLFPS